MKKGIKRSIDQELLEVLAELEHEQWAHWTKYMLDNLTPENIERWKKQIETKYTSLSEKEKESDRAWARKVIAVCNVWVTEKFEKWASNRRKRKA